MLEEDPLTPNTNPCSSLGFGVSHGIASEMFLLFPAQFHGAGSWQIKAAFQVVLGWI